MKAVVQRVKRAEVRVAGEVVGRIAGGMMVLLGVERGDTEADVDAVARKLSTLRIFPGRYPMDVALAEIGGSCLVVSQFTLAGNMSKGNRPSFERAEEPARAEVLYLRCVEQLRALGVPTETGRFAADMEVDLVNDGPVTFMMSCQGGKVG